MSRTSRDWHQESVGVPWGLILQGVGPLQDCSGFPTPFCQTDSPRALFFLPLLHAGTTEALKKDNFPKSVQGPKIKSVLERTSQPPVSLQETHLPRSADQALEGGGHCTGSLTWKRGHVWGSTGQMPSASPHLHHQGLVWRVAFSVPRGEGPQQEVGGFQNNGRVGEVAAKRADSQN